MTSLISYFLFEVFMAYWVAAAAGAAYYGYRALSTAYNVGNTAMTVARGTYRSVQWVSSQLPQQRQISTTIERDPISTLAIIALLPYKESNSRIAVLPGGIIVQQPSDFHNMQGVWRALRGDSREDLSIIENDIRAAALLFKPENNEEVKRLFKHAKEGLNALQKTYSDKSANTCAALEYWKDLIKESYKDGISEEQELGPLAAKVQDLWDDQDLKVINGLLDKAKDEQKGLDPELEVKCQPQVDTIETYLASKSHSFSRILPGNRQ